jgi:predicted nucleotidyltransferase
MKKLSYLEKNRLNNSFPEYKKEFLETILTLKNFKKEESEQTNKNNESNIKSFIEDKFLREGDKLLSLQVTGSFLHGTATKNSDLDLKGIFVPSKESLILKEKRQSYKYTSTKNTDSNGCKDVDVSFYSLHFALNKISRGDFNFLELLFALDNKETNFYISEEIKKLYYNRFDLFSKEGLKFSGLGFIKKHCLDIKDKIINKEDYNSKDVKGLAHSYRTLIIIRELLETKKIQFPLKEADLIREIKNWKIKLMEIINIIENELPALKNQIEQSNLIKEEVNKEYIENLILSFYK